ncbi:MAG TPA: methyltransferase [Geothermobacteraceae bacterium]|nr:methyltransferase [Geothermobacteraceae bacterium]
MACPWGLSYQGSDLKNKLENRAGNRLLRLLPSPVVGYRHSLDPFLLASFVQVKPSDRRAADLGTGSGIIALQLALRYADITVTGVELQESLADLARQNVALNNLEAKLVILNKDIRKAAEWASPQEVDLVVSNPPYRIAGTGYFSPDPGRAAARHELAGGLEDFVAAAAYLLKNGGRFFVIYLAERLADLLVAMRQKHLEPKRLRLVHSRNGEPAKLVLVEGRRAGKPGMKVDPPLFIYAGEDYTPEVLACYQGGGA